MSALPGSRLQRRLAAVALPVCVALLWPLLRPYDWLARDGQLYALQAMARAYPGRYANELFFMFGSQDRYTILTALVAPVYGWLGVDHASALLTVLGALLWWSACWLLARAVAGPRLAWVCTVVVMAAPGWYGGGGEVFRYAETYFSARLPAEGLVLLALALQAARRPAWGCVALALSFLIHPLMTLPGIAMFVLLQVPTRRWPWLVLLAAALVAASIGVAMLAPVGRLAPIAPDWLPILKVRSVFLFPYTWTFNDWRRAATVVCVLIAAIRLLGDPRRVRLAAAAAIVGVAGVLIAVVVAQYWPIELLLQAQPWRTLWLASVLAYLLIAVAVVDTWRGDAYARASALLLVTAACALTTKATLAASGAAVLLAWLPGRPTLPHGRYAVFGASAALASTVVFTLLSAVSVTKIPTWGDPAGARLEVIRNVMALAVPGLLVILGITWLTWRPTWTRMAAAWASLAAIAALTLGAVGQQVTAQAFSGQPHTRFAAWRTLVPPGSTVLWPTSPVTVWFLLERPNFISVAQLAGVIFSRDLALEGMDRIQSVAGYANQGWLLGRPERRNDGPVPLTQDILLGLCRDRRLDFVVAPERLSAQAPSMDWPDRTQQIYLYDCSRYRPGSPPG